MRTRSYYWKRLHRINYALWFSECTSIFIKWGLMPIIFYILIFPSINHDIINVFAVLGLSRTFMALINPPINYEEREPQGEKIN